jgi:hypothetical protein
LQIVKKAFESLDSKAFLFRGPEGGKLNQLGLSVSHEARNAIWFWVLSKYKVLDFKKYFLIFIAFIKLII